MTPEPTAMDATPALPQVLEEGYRGFLIRIPIPEATPVAAGTPVQVSVAAISQHAIAHMDAIRWAPVEGSEGDLHTLARIKQAIDEALDGVDRAS